MHWTFLQILYKTVQAYNAHEDAMIYDDVYHGSDSDIHHHADEHVKDYIVPHWKFNN